MDDDADDADAERYTTIELRQDEGTAWLALARPDSGNPIDAHACGELLHALGHAAADPEVQVIALAANGPMFSVAGDMVSPLYVGEASPHPAIDGGLLFAALADCPKPVVAVVQGECHSAGLGLIAAADLTIASQKARFWIPEVKGGMWPTMAIAALARAIGPRRTLELTLGAEPIDVRAAQGLGLVQRIVEPEQLEIEAFVLLRALGQRSPSAYRHGLPAFRRGLGEDLTSAMVRARRAHQALLATDDAAEARAAYQAHRKPIWRDQ